jgi:hypothetical protein
VLLAALTISLTAYGLVYLLINAACTLSLFVGTILDNFLTNTELIVRAPIKEAAPLRTEAGHPTWNEKTGDHIETAKSDSTEQPTRHSNGHDDDGDWQLIPNLNRVERRRPRSPQTPLQA